MDARAFHVPSIAGSGRVVHPQQYPIAEPRSKLLHEKAEDRRGQLSGSPPHTGQALVEAVPIVFDSCREEPGTGGASVVGQKHPGDHNRQAKGNATVHDGLQHRDRLLHRAGQGHFGLAGLLPLGIRTLKSLPPVVLRLLGFLVFRLRTLRRTLILGHPWLSQWV